MKSLISIFSRSKAPVAPLAPAEPTQQPRCNALELSPLGKLPAELILRIALFLTLESRAAFSLCCSHIYSVLGSWHTKGLKRTDRYKLLELLERDLPQYVACYSCAKLHSIERAHQYDWTNPENRSINGHRRPCFKEDWSFRAREVIHRHFSYPLFQMTMKLHRQGQGYGELLKSLSPKTLTWSYNEISVQRCWQARIVDRSFLVIREQTIFLFPSSKDCCKYDSYFVLKDWEFDLRLALKDTGICIHHPWLSRSDFVGDWNLVQNEKWKQLRKSCGRLLMNGCRECTTEFRVDFKSLGGGRSALFVTRWMHLGDGRSPLDRAWRSHVDQPTDPPVGVEYEVGSIAAGFEGKEMNKFGFDTRFDHKICYSRRTSFCPLRIMFWYLEREYPHFNRELINRGELSNDRILRILYWRFDQNPRLAAF